MAAERRVQEAQALELAKRTMPGVDLTQFGDPMAALEHTVAYSHHLALRLAAIVERIPMISWPTVAGSASSCGAR